MAHFIQVAGNVTTATGKVTRPHLISVDGIECIIPRSDSDGNTIFMKSEISITTPWSIEQILACIEGKEFPR